MINLFLVLIFVVIHGGVFCLMSWKIFRIEGRCFHFQTIYYKVVKVKKLSRAEQNQSLIHIVAKIKPTRKKHLVRKHKMDKNKALGLSSWNSGHKN